MNRQPTIRVCAALLAALLCAAPGPARATGKIRSVDVYDPEDGHSFTNRPVTLAAGDTFRVRFRLVNLEWAQTVADASYANPWEFRYTGPLTGDAEADARTMAESEKPRLGLWFGGQVREADCVNWPMGEASDWLAERLDGERHYTDLIFEYTVRPGDLAWPVQLANEAGTGPADQDDRPYLKCNGRETLWKMVDAKTGSVTNELAFGPEALSNDPDFAGQDLTKWNDVSSPACENRDYDLSGAGVHVRAVDFDPAFFDGDAGVWRSIAQGSTAAEPTAPSIRIGDDDGDGALDPLVLYLWTADPNVAEIAAGGAVDDVRSAVFLDGITRKVGRLRVDRGDKTVAFGVKATGAVGDTTPLFLATTPTNIFTAAGDIVTNFLGRTVRVDEPIVAYPLWVGDVQVFSTNRTDILGDRTAWFEGTATNGTLSLSAATLSGTHAFAGGSSGASGTAVVYAGPGFDLAVSLAGTNRLEDASATHGLFAERDLSLAGGGTLFAQGGETGIGCGGRLSVGGCTVAATGGAAGRGISVDGLADYGENGPADWRFDGAGFGTKTEFGYRLAANPDDIQHPEEFLVEIFDVPFGELAAEIEACGSTDEARAAFERCYAHLLATSADTNSTGRFPTTLADMMVSRMLAHYLTIPAIVADCQTHNADYTPKATGRIAFATTGAGAAFARESGVTAGADSAFDGSTGFGPGTAAGEGMLRLGGIAVSGTASIAAAGGTVGVFSGGVLSFSGSSETTAEATGADGSAIRSRRKVELLDGIEVLDPVGGAVGAADGGGETVLAPGTGGAARKAVIARRPPSVSDVVARQRWPWNGLVDIDYEVGGSTNLLADLTVQITFAASDGRSWVATNFLAGAEPSAERGPHRATWDTAADGATNVVAAEVVATVTLVRPPPRWCVVDLSGGTNATSYPVTYFAEPPAGGWNADAYKTTNLVLRLVKPSDWANGTFTMAGSYETTLTNAFWIGVFEMTQRQWELVAGGRPSFFRRDECYATRPVEKVSYAMIRGSDAGSQWPDSGDVDEDSFLGRLRARTGRAFDLPTEAQWEFACRATTTADYNNGTVWTGGTSCTNLDPLGRYWFNGGGNGNGNPDCDTGKGTSAAGGYLPNEWGLYDFHGNVWEWCLDWSGDLGDGAVEPAGAPSGEKRVLRGGCWSDNAVNCRSTGRIGMTPDFVGNFYGFRLCLPAGPETAP